jgi:hypothetical protein
MIERKRIARTFELVPGEGTDDIDLELGNVDDQQETGVIREPTLEQEVDNWDEHAQDDEWIADEAEATDGVEATGETEDATATKKRND